jgi:speckle-type POZ protein
MVFIVQDLEGSNLDVAMAQHLLVAADRYQLGRLRRICERRLCETVEVITDPSHLAVCSGFHDIILCSATWPNM